MKNFFRAAFLLGALIASQAAFAGNGYPEVSCSTYGGAAASCNQCFHGDTLYQGFYVTDLFDDFTAGTSQTAIFANNPGTVSTEYLQSGFSWTESFAMWRLNSALFTAFSPTRGWYIPLQPGETASAYVQSVPGTGLQFVSGPVGSGDRNQPTFKLTYDTVFYTKATNFATQESHKECVFYYSNWCGDGVKDTNEDCDLGAQNGVTGSSCPLNCKLAPFDLSLKKFVSGQDAENGSPVAVNRGGTINYTFETKNNGSSPTQGQTVVDDIGFPSGITLSNVSGAGWNCTHTASTFSCSTNAVLSAGASFPTITATALVEATAVAGSPLMNYSCIRNPLEDRTNNFGNNNCDAANVIINLPPNAPNCIAGPTNGTQTNPISGTTAGLCPAGQAIGNFSFIVTGNTTTYTWSCDTSKVGGQCQATYTPGTP